jgi:RNase P/RNase MRP subunit POP5
MKPLLPTLKERQRYVAYEIITRQPIDDISDTLLRSLAETLGTIGMARAGILSVHYDAQSQTGILRVNHDQVQNTRAALILTTYLGRTPVLIRTLGVSGILNKATRFIPETARRTLKEHTKGLRGTPRQ